MRKNSFLNEVRERLQRFCDLLDRNIGKDVGIDDLLEVVPGRIDVAQQLAFDATIPVRTIR